MTSLDRSYMLMESGSALGWSLMRESTKPSLKFAQLNSIMKRFQKEKDKKRKRDSNNSQSEILA